MIHMHRVIISAMIASTKKESHNTPVENLKQRTWSMKGNFQDCYPT